MAVHVAAGEVEIARDKDGLVAVRRDVVVDPERGVAAEVERTVVAVEDSEGNVAVMQQNRVRAVGVAVQVISLVYCWGMLLSNFVSRCSIQRAHPVYIHSIIEHCSPREYIHGHVYIILQTKSIISPGYTSIIMHTGT